MKFMITNGNEYIGAINPITNEKDKRGYAVVDQMGYAAKFKMVNAQNFIKKELHGDSKWGIRKIANTCSKKNYVITTGVNYVTSSTNGLITADFSKVKWFRSVADADVFISTHPKLFNNAMIVDENGCVADAGEKRTFTDEQLEFLGVKEMVKCEKRIIIPKSTREVVYENGKGVCAICGRPVGINEFTIDHIVPLSRGGKNEISNYQIACNDCNQLKSSRMDNEFLNGITTILSHQLSRNSRQDLEDILIRTIVRKKINTMEEMNYGI